MKKHLMAAIAPLILLVLLSGCSQKANEKAVTQAVKDYNAALVQCYRDLDASHIKPYATEAQQHRLVGIVIALKESEERLLLQLDALTVKSVTVSGEKAVAETAEKWTYWREAKDERTPSTHNKSEDYAIKYTLKKHEGRWKIDGVKGAL